MDWFRPIGIAGLAWRGVATVADRAALWTPAVIAAAVQTPILMLLVYFYLPPLVPVAGPLVRALGGEAATHYPAHMLAVPSMVDYVDLALTILLAWIAWGVTTYRFAISFGLDREGDGWPNVRRAAVTLGLIAGVSVALQLVYAAVLARAPAGVHAGSLLGQLGRLGLAVAVQSLLAYACAFVVLHDHPVGSAILASVRLALRALGPTLILVAAGTAALFPFSLALRELAPLAPQRPELLAAVLALRAVVGVVATVVMVGSITRLFLSKTRALR